MPVIIKHVQLNKEKQVNYDEWCNIDNGAWTLIKQWDIVQLEHFQYWDKQWVNHHIMEKSLAIDKYITPYPNRYRYIDLADIDNRISIGIHNLTTHLNQPLLNLDLPKEIPITMERKNNIKTTQRGTFANRIFDKTSINYFWLPLMVLLIGTLLLKILGVI